MDNHRRFGVADGMILIGGFAAGLWLIRVVELDFPIHDLWRDLTDIDTYATMQSSMEMLGLVATFVGVPFMAAWSPACFLLHLIPPRPRWRDLRRRPGFLACLLPTLVAAPLMVLALLKPQMGWHGRRPDYTRELVLCGILSSTGVLWSWIVLAIGGLWRARPSGIDRLGQLTGVCWLFVNAFIIIYYADIL